MTDQLSIEPSLSGGYLILTDDVFNPKIEHNFSIILEIKLNGKDFDVGIEYSFRTNRNNVSKKNGSLHYIGVSIGARF